MMRAHRMNLRVQCSLPERPRRSVVEDTVSGVSGVDLDQRKGAGPDSSRTSRVFDRSRAFRTNAWLVAEPGGDASGLRDPSFAPPERGSPPHTCPGSRARSAARPARWSLIYATVSDRTVTIAGVDHACKVQRQCILGPRRRRLSFRHGVDGLHALCRRTVTTFDLPAYTEQALSGANTFALNYASKGVTATRSELGVRTDKSWAMQDATFTVRGRLAWAHDFNTDRNIAAPSRRCRASFVVNGAAPCA
jgi:hypothetical protein